MSIKYLTYAFDARVNNPLRKLVLLKLCDNANDDGECWPSFGKIAAQCEISRRSAISHVQALIDDGFIVSEARFKNGEQTSNVYTILKEKLISSGESAALPSEIPAPPLVQELHPPSAGAAPRTVIEPPVLTNSVSAQRKSKKKTDLTFCEWKDKTKNLGEKLISDYDPVFDYCEKAGIPEDFLAIAWNVFTDYYTNDNLKKYTDWRRHFLNSVKGDWLKLWAFNQSGECYLTTKGKQNNNHMGFGK